MIVIDYDKRIAGNYFAFPDVYAVTFSYDGTRYRYLCLSYAGKKSVEDEIWGRLESIVGDNTIMEASTLAELDEAADLGLLIEKVL